MKKTLRIAIGFTIWAFVVWPIGCVVFSTPWWLAGFVGVCSGSAAMMWWIVYADERKRLQWRKEHGYS